MKLLVVSDSHRETEHMLYTMFRQAELSFPTEHMLLLTLEDSVIAKSKEDELIHILDKVLNERCGFQVKFDIAYKEASESKYKEEDELRIQKVVEGITRRMENVGEEQHGQPEMEKKNDTGVKTEKPAKAAAAASFQTERKSEKSFAAKKGEGFQRRRAGGTVPFGGLGVGQIPAKAGRCTARLRLCARRAR